ncbi:MAG: cytochrome c-type biogenesis protein CcmH [Gemmatimonadota bacterium]|nr:cytochrome c-type biogenesis protein CcmH [Gemmatimonadota bacterium]MDH4347562.1 cytochrome c-type biogenesis protein CcmH [Gemmatimonadota bacterium]MDH5283123.1 cytochrome c-type biogenesis protein CcmH [Gemmatimonadota bacterium]
MTSRRVFLLHGLVGALPALLHAGPAAGQQQPLAGQGEAGELRDPAAAGRPRDRATQRDNDEYINQIEHRLQCTCGCTLDIYTCRTTDFTCTFSPALHKEVLALRDEGKDADAIIAAFVAKYGEKVLMAPKPEGFNIAGYVVPGIAILLVGSVMAVLMVRRSRLTAATAAAAPLGGEGTVPGASADEMERLRRELREFDE